VRESTSPPLRPHPGRVTAHARGSRLMQFSVSHPCTFDIARHLRVPTSQLKCCQGCLAIPTGPMLSSFPSLSENEFRDGCQALQRRCQGRLDDTKWLDIRWQQDILTIKKLYHSGSSKDLQTDVKTHRPEDLASCLGDVDSEDEVLFWPRCFYEVLTLLTSKS
jgi:hypothetical protein